MPHRCVAGGCSNTRKDEVSLHLWPEDPRFARLSTNAVKNTRSDFSNLQVQVDSVVPILPKIFSSLRVL